MVQRELTISDIHIPYHDPHAWELVLNIAESLRPTAINIDGDALDFCILSLFDKSLDQIKEGQLQENLDQWFRMVMQLKRRAINAKLRFVPGNHEDRLRRYLMRNPELYGLRALELPMLLRCDELDIEYFQDEIEVIPGILIVKHGKVVRRDSAYSAKGELEGEKYAVSTITGHTHRLGTHYARTRRGVVKAHENGCLCLLNPEYVKNPNWQQGCTLVTHWGGELFHIDDIPFLNTGEHVKAVVHGQVITL